MLSSYTVCGYCFQKLDVGSRCSCVASQNGDEKICIRYTESLDMDLNESQPSILGDGQWAQERAEMVVDGDELGATLVLEPGIELCDSCKSELNVALEWVSEIINRCNKNKRGAMGR